MPKVSEHPEFLRPYLQHGVELSYSGSADAVGDCPFCSKEQKFHVSQKNGMYSCKVCGSGVDDGKGGGNTYSFLRNLHTLSIENTPLDELEMVAEERKLKVETLIEEGLVKSIIDGEWLLPTYEFPTDKKCEINNLYRWSMMPDGKGGFKRRLQCTSTFKNQIFGFQFWDKKKKKVAITEGRWDGMGLREAFQQFGFNNIKLFRTDDPAKCLYADFNIASVPGADQFADGWEEHFRGLDVTLFFDNDHPRVNKKTKKLMPPVGFEGMKRAAKKLKGVAKSLHALVWGEHGFTEEYESGTDIRDMLAMEIE